MFVLRIGRAELGVGEVVERRPTGHIRVNFHAPLNEAPHGQILRPEDVIEISEEARGRLYAAD